MRAIYKNLMVILSLLFTLSIFGFAYYLYIFPERVANQTHIISLAETDALNPVMMELYTFSLISLGLGFAIVLLSVFNKTDSSESNVVYIEKFKDKKESNSATKQEEKTGKQEADVDVLAIQDQVKAITDPKKKAEKILSLLADKVEASQAAYYTAAKQDGKNMITLFAAYAFVLPESQTVSYEFGEGLAGQVAKEQKLINISDIPEGYITILSGLGESKPAHLIISPVLQDKQLLGVAEIAFFKKLDKNQVVFIQKVLQLLADSSEKQQKPVKKKDAH
jgi:putative methionine-R-sulfoxide reductase with GAF domain